MDKRLLSILRKEQLEHLLPKFQEQGIIDSVLCDLSDNDLKELGIDKFGERKRLLTDFKSEFIEEEDNDGLSEDEDDEENNTEINLDAFIERLEEIKSDITSEIVGHAQQVFDGAFVSDQAAATLPWDRLAQDTLADALATKSSMPPNIRIGEFYNQNLKECKESRITLPACLEISKRKGLFFRSNRGSKSEELLQAITLRLMCSLQLGTSKLHLIDLQTRGRAFAALGSLDQNLAPIAPASPEAVGNFLKEMEDRVASLTRSCLSRYDWLCDYNDANPDEVEAYHLICISGFPNGLEEPHIEALQRLLHDECAARAGIYFFFSSDGGLPELSEFIDIPYIFTDGTVAEVIDSVFNTSSEGDHSDLALIPEVLPTNASEIVDFLNAALKSKPKHKKVSISVSESESWTSNAASGVAIPIGKSGKNDLLFRLGNDSIVHHALVGGATGTGKTILLHNIILNAAELYSPEDLQMILMDFKEGTEFACYEGLPHMRVLSIASELHFGHSVFEWLVAERMRRATFFKKAGVANLADYINKTGQKLPRILVLMDEFQRLLADSTIGSQVSVLLDDIVRTGRSFGINLILSTQSLANVHMESSTLTSLGLRICLRLSEQETNRFLTHDNSVPSSFNRPGQALYNDTEGRKEGNSEFQVAFVDVSEIPSRCKALRERESERYGRQVLEGARVFHGEMPINPAGRIPVIALDKLQVFIGEPLKIQAEPLAVALEQQDGANILAIGQGMEILNTLSNNIAAQLQQSPLKPEILVADALPLAKERWAELVENGVQFLANPMQVNAALDQLTMEIENRKLAEETNSFPPKVLFLIEPQLNKAFPLGNGMDNSPAVLKVNTLLEQGPRLGIHIVLITSRLARADKVFGQYGGQINRQYFASRIVFRSDEAENLLGYDAPTKNIGEYSGVLSDESTGEITPFQIYETIGI
jgi:S-DNA-T family DNA segregation ATPase FtsK/SpoIIIE